MDSANQAMAFISWDSEHSRNFEFIHLMFARLLECSSIICTYSLIQALLQVVQFLKFVITKFLRKIIMLPTKSLISSQ